MPCCSRNSLRWNPGGSFCRIVCSITRGPANPINAPGSAIFRSPSIAKDAVTPPVVGSVNTDIYGTFASSMRASAAEILASCIRLIAPSIMRAPREAEMTISGTLESVACSTARVIPSPTTAPMLPPMKAYSMALTITGRPCILPRALRMASGSPVSACACLSRDAYAFRSTNFRGSVETRFESKTSYWLSSSNWERRVRASIRKCLSHLGQTFKFSSRSFFQITWRQPSHLTHRPSVRTFFSPEVSNSPDWRLNHVIVIVESSNCRTDELNSSSYFVNPKNLTIQKLVLDSPLCHHALFVGVLYLAHLRYRVGKFDNCRMGVAPRQDNMHHVRFLLEAFHDFARVEHPVADGVVDFVKNDQIPVAGLDCLFRF